MKQRKKSIEILCLLMLSDFVSSDPLFRKYQYIDTFLWKKSVQKNILTSLKSYTMVIFIF